jgi:predicted metalloprotease with PDZ domain
MEVYHKTSVDGKVEYKPDILTIPVGKLDADPSALKVEAWGFTAVRDDAGRIIISAVEPASPASNAALAAGKTLLAGLGTSLSPEPIPLEDLDQLKKLMIALDDAAATELTLFTIDMETGKGGKVKLTREAMEDILFAMRCRMGIGEYLAADDRMSSLLSPS